MIQFRRAGTDHRVRTDYQYRHFTARLGVAVQLICQRPLETLPTNLIMIRGNPDKHRLVADIGIAFRRGKDYFESNPQLTAGELYDFVAELATQRGWEFGAPTAGHLIGQFPHESDPGDSKRFSIRHGNPQSLREPDERGNPRHWILEIHFVDRARQIGGFFEELLTVPTPG